MVPSHLSLPPRLSILIHISLRSTSSEVSDRSPLCCSKIKPPFSVGDQRVSLHNGKREQQERSNKAESRGLWIQLNNLKWIADTLPEFCLSRLVFNISILSVNK